MTVKAEGLKLLPRTIAGSWKFQRTSHDFEANVAEIALLAIDLVNTNPGGGIYKSVRIRSTAENELGIDVLYEVGPNESLSYKDKEWKNIYKDFFYRRAGNSFKGWDIGHSVTEIILVTE